MSPRRTGVSRKAAECVPGAVGEAADEAFVTVLSLGPSFAIKVEQKYDFFQKIHTFAFKIIFRYSMSHKQRTLKAPVVFRGKGLHTGLDVTMTINPADSGCGIRFRRIDLEGQPFVDALAENVVDTSRGTTIEKKGVRIGTIEHVMAALWGSGVDNAQIDIDAPETPILDGSALPFVEAIASAGTVEQPADRVYFHITEKTVYSIPERGVEIVAYPDDEFSVNVNVDFNSKIIGNQYARLDRMEDFAEQIAPCRTFVFLHELEPLINNNLIKGFGQRDRYRREPYFGRGARPSVENIRQARRAGQRGLSEQSAAAFPERTFAA